MRLSVVVDTYQWPQALHAVLLGLADQSDPDFDLVVADDGSGPDTAALAEAWKAYLRLTHVRQDDDGYRLARVRNLGAQEARGDYLVFLNSDTVPAEALRPGDAEGRGPGLVPGRQAPAPLPRAERARPRRPGADPSVVVPSLGPPFRPGEPARRADGTRPAAAGARRPARVRTARRRLRLPARDLARGLRARQRLRHALRRLGRRGRRDGRSPPPCRPPLRLGGAAKHAAPPLARVAHAVGAPERPAAPRDGDERLHGRAPGLRELADTR